MNVYLANEYREFLERVIEANRHVRGYKSRLAEAAGCHGSYFSQMLKGAAELSPEHALNLAQFLCLNESESDFFLDLLLRDRAGSARLRKFYERRIAKARESHDLIGAKFQKEKVLPIEQAAIYYSSWHYAAVHILALVKDCTAVEKIADRLRLSAKIVKDTLAELVTMGVLGKKGDAYSEMHVGLYLPKNFPMNATNHISWRLRAIESIQRRDAEAVHLLHIGNLSRRDVAAVKSKLVECLESIRKIEKSSGQEDAVAISFDFFPV